MLSKVALYPKQDTGVGFYRVIQPGRFLKREGLAKEVMTVPFSGTNSGNDLEFWDDRTMMEITANAEVFLTTILFSEQDIIRVLNLRKWAGFKWIVDIDDNFYAVPKDNPAYEKSKELRAMFDMCLTLADGVVVSVPMLKDLYQHLNPNIFIQPNGIDFALWEGLKKPVQKKEKLRIGWEGAYGHKDDLSLVYPALKALQSDFDVQLVAFGTKPEQLEWEYHKWVSFADYPQKLTSLGIDIMIAPLVDSAYNRCKSNLRLLDAAVSRTPVVYSPTINYRGFPGLTASNSYEWYDALSRLVSEKDMRRKVGEGCYRYAERNYDMKNLVVPLAGWMHLLPRRTDLEP